MKASLKKGMSPGPVYEAHFGDGSIIRMSYWQLDGKPWDFARGKCICQFAWQAREMTYRLMFDHEGETGYSPTARDRMRAEFFEGRRELPSIVSGFVDHPTLGRFPDPMEVAAPKPKRITAKQAREALANVLAYLDGDHDDWSAIETARALAA